MELCSNKGATQILKISKLTDVSKQIVYKGVVDPALVPSLALVLS